MLLANETAKLLGAVNAYENCQWEKRGDYFYYKKAAEF